MTIKHHNNHFNHIQRIVHTNAPFQSSRLRTSSTHPNYSIMGCELSYDSVSLHTPDFLEIQGLLRNSDDVSEISNPQTPEVNQQRVQRVRVVRGFETNGRYDQPDCHH